MTGISAVLVPVDHFLRMFYTHACRKIFLEDRKALVIQCAPCFICAVSQTKDHGIRFKDPHLCADAFQFSIPDGQGCHPGIEEYLAAQGNDLFPDPSDNGLQLVCTKMRHMPVHDCRICACFHEFRKHLLYSGILGAGGQFSVREGSRAPFAVLDIGFRIELAALKECCDILRTLFHHFAAFQNNRSHAAFCQDQTGKHPGWSEAHDHGPLCVKRCFRADVIVSVSFLHILQAQIFLLIPHFGKYRI